jgi:hypothetical protein
MIDPELKAHLETIEKEIIELRKGSNGLIATLVRGLIYGAGYIIGAVLIILLIGWILNIIGVIPAFNSQVIEFRSALERIGTPIK